METMDGAQVWTMIGAFTALMMGMLTVVSTLFIRVLRSEIGSLRNEMTARFDAVNTRFDAVGTRIDGVNARIDGLDRDVQALVKRTFGLDRE
ncbi:hypothetical protein AB1285_12015 [Microbacterium sp. NRRL B-14842]|uniref:hypothetical protein n=1 Tax=Microbacterium sp. NRRL B-14842 TaxID=3162881 RepID=UPI003515DEBC